METVSNLTNQPIVATLAGKSHSFRQLTLTELFGKFEAEVKNDWRTRVYEMAAGLTGDDKIAYLSHETSHPLPAERVIDLVQMKMESNQGVDLILKWTHIPDDKTDILPTAVVLQTNPTDKIAVKALMEELTGTAGVVVKEGGADVDPKAQ